MCRRGRAPLACSASTPAPRARSKIPRLPSIWSTPAGAGTRQLTGNCTFRAPGQPTPVAAGMPGCRDAGLDQDTAFATRPKLATRMITPFLEAGHRAARVAGDEVYGGNPKLRKALEERGTGYVLAVACSHEATTGAGKFRADTLAKKVPKRAWQKLSAGTGAKGHRFYDWTVVDLVDPDPGSRQLLIRRNRSTGPAGVVDLPASQQRLPGFNRSPSTGRRARSAGTSGPATPTMRAGSPSWPRSSCSCQLLLPVAVACLCHLSRGSGGTRPTGFLDIRRPPVPARPVAAVRRSPRRR